MTEFLMGFKAIIDVVNADDMWMACRESMVRTFQTGNAGIISRSSKRMKEIRVDDNLQGFGPKPVNFFFGNIWLDLQT